MLSNGKFCASLSSENDRKPPENIGKYTKIHEKDNMLLETCCLMLLKIEIN